MQIYASDVYQHIHRSGGSRSDLSGKYLLEKIERVRPQMSKEVQDLDLSHVPEIAIETVGTFVGRLSQKHG